MRISGTSPHGGGRQPNSMTRLHDLALQFQQALNSFSAPFTHSAADAVGQALHEEILMAVHVCAAHPWEDSSEDYSVLEPIILRTTLATSIVAYFERIPWEALTPQMLSEPEGTPVAAVKYCSSVLMSLGYAALVSKPTHRGDTVLALLLQQVIFSSFSPIPGNCLR